MFYNGRLRIGTGLAILDALMSIQDQIYKIDTPYLLQHGEADFVCHISGSEAFHAKTSSSDKTFKSYPGGAHDLSNEPPPIRNAVVQDFVEWLEERSN
jgi:acylglycerol lipase